VILLCAALALACVALGVALRRARRDAAEQMRQVNVAAEMLARVPVEAQLAAVAPPIVCAAPVRALPRRRISEQLPVCSACARLAIGAEVIRNLRAPATEIRGPVATSEAPRAFIVRWGRA
jgi:hypothetical protein